MKLYFNGCSHTVGICSDLHNIEQTYPYKLSKILNAEFINSALPRSSNNRIVRTTIEDICSMEQLPDVAIIQWTYYDRFESPVLTNEFEYARIAWKDYRLRDLEWKQFNPSAMNKNTENTSVEKDYIENKPNAFNSFFTNVISLDNFLINKNIRPVHMFFPGSKWLRINNSTVKNLLGNCNKNNFLNLPFIGIETYLEDKDYKRASDYHFLEPAHDQIANWLKDFILYNKPVQYEVKESDRISNKDKVYIYQG